MVRKIPLILVVALLVCRAQTASAIDPQSPIVVTSVKNSIEYLELHPAKRAGARALVGLTFAKYGADEKHPRIQEGLKYVKSVVKNGPERIRTDIYSTGISIMFLCALDPSKYRYEIEALAKSLHLRQKRHGAWGYPSGNHAGSCDTSMTQYGVLGLWEAEELAGVETPSVVWDRVARWLILTQADSGGFGYQGNPAPALGKHVTQSGVRHSMTAAAVGSMYIVKDRLGIRKLRKGAADDTPPAFELFESPEARAERIKTKIALRHFARTLAEGNRWLDDKYVIGELKSWEHYSLYAYERYQTLKEAESGNEREEGLLKAKSVWYHKGARHLIKTQEADGSWEGQAGVPDTCFATLFLLGSTRKTLEKSSVVRYKAGILIGGQGLPKDKQLRVRDGKVVVAPLKAPVETILKLAAQPKHPDFAKAKEALADLAAEGTKDKLTKIGNPLGKLALNGENSIRLLAIKALRRSRNLDQVPLLIHLLNDQDIKVTVEASQALADVSRRFTDFGLGLRPDAKKRESAIEQWKAWYRTVRPDVNLETYDPTGEAP